jgi:hypothetical protein
MMAGKTAEYRIISHVEWQDSEDEVNTLLKEGWELHGDLNVIGDNPSHYVQAVVRKEYSEYAGIDYSLSVQIDDLDGIRHALDKIGEALDTAATTLIHIAKTLPAPE